jgi:methionine-rich copper-binding protein CopC
MRSFRGFEMRAGLAVGLALVLAACLQPASGPAPRVIETSPAQGAVLAAGPQRISVRFSAPMQPMSWTFAPEDRATFPRTTATPQQSEDLTTFHLSVLLEPGRSYVVLINTDRDRGFKDREGRPAEPYRLAFSAQ